MGKHVSALGFLYALSGLFTSALGVLVLILGSGSWGRAIRELLALLGLDHLARWLGMGFGATLLGLAVLCFATAFGLFARKGWGRILGLIGAATHLATFSWPALLGLYGAWVLLSADGRREFRGR